MACEAMRKLLVLLKIYDGMLPLDADKTVLVVSDGANNISKHAGGFW